MDLAPARDLLAHQDGVIARRQLIELGATEGDLRRWIRRRELVVVHPGVYVTHTGPMSWTSRAWAAVQSAWPAVLAGPSALEPGGEVVHVAVAPGRTLAPRSGVKVIHLDGLERRALWHLAPPRLRFEDALVGVCAALHDRSRALVLLTDACRQRRTTPGRLLTEIQGRPNIRHRRWLIEVLQDAAHGVQSLLESAYLTKVERAHRLPQGARQVRSRAGGSVVYRDVLYAKHGVAVELDGRLGHDLSRDRWDDMDRDLDAAVDGLITLRVGWRQADLDPCRTAARLAKVLAQRGWTEHPRPCGPHCLVVRPSGWGTADAG